jgi:hypothetical protein
MLKIGFDNVAQPDFAFHETGVVRFGNIAKPYYAPSEIHFNKTPLPAILPKARWE